LNPFVLEDVGALRRRNRSPYLFLAQPYVRVLAIVAVDRILAACVPAAGLSQSAAEDVPDRDRGDDVQARTSLSESETHVAIKIAAMTPTIATNSVVLSAFLVSSR
jgi:hypothetical protein